MTCMRCGSAEAVIKRENAFYCAKCVLARDWEEVIALVQRERVDVPGAQMGRKSTSAATATIDMDAAAPTPEAPVAEFAPQEPTPEPAAAGSAPAPQPDSAPAFTSEADPFG